VRVDTWGAVPNTKNLEARSCTIKAGGKTVSIVASISFILHVTKDRSSCGLDFVVQNWLYSTV